MIKEGLQIKEVESVQVVRAINDIDFIVSSQTVAIAGIELNSMGEETANDNKYAHEIIAFPSLLRYEKKIGCAFYSNKNEGILLDLRQKIINTYFEGKTSQRQLAKRFQVAVSFVEKLLKQYRETGSIAPKVRRQQTPTKLSEEQLNILSSIVATNNDATLDELRCLLKQQIGV